MTTHDMANASNTTNRHINNTKNTDGSTNTHKHITEQSITHVICMSMYMDIDENNDTHNANADDERILAIRHTPRHIRILILHEHEHNDS